MAWFYAAEWPTFAPPLTARQGLGKVHRIFNRLGTDRFNPHAHAQNCKILLRLRNF